MRYLLSEAVVGEQAVTVVVEVAHQRHGYAHPVELLADVRYRRSGLGRVDLGRVDGDAHQLAAGTGQLLALDGGADDVHGVGVGHRLHPHGRVAPHRHDMVTPDHTGLAGAAGGRRCERNIGTG